MTGLPLNAAAAEGARGERWHMKIVDLTELEKLAGDENNCLILVP